MNFELSEEYLLFRDTVRRWVINECPKDWCRDLERKEHQYPQELWDRLTKAGFNGVGIPEEYGGIGGDIVIQAIFAREFSRHAAGLAWIWGITSFSGAQAIAVHGSEEQRHEVSRRRDLHGSGRGRRRSSDGEGAPQVRREDRACFDHIAGSVQGEYVPQEQRFSGCQVEVPGSGDLQLLVAGGVEDREYDSSPGYEGRGQEVGGGVRGRADPR